MTIKLWNDLGSDPGTFELQWLQLAATITANGGTVRHMGDGIDTNPAPGFDGLSAVIVADIRDGHLDTCRQAVIDTNRLHGRSAVWWIETLWPPTVLRST